MSDLGVGVFAQVLLEATPRSLVAANLPAPAQIDNKLFSILGSTMRGRSSAARAFTRSVTSTQLPILARETAICVSDRSTAVENPTVFTIVAAEPIFHLKRLAPGESPEEGLHTPVNIFRMDARGPTIADFLFKRASVNASHRSLK